MFGKKRPQTSQKPSWSEAAALMEEMSKKEPVQIAADLQLPHIARGLRLDGIEPDADLMQRLAHIAAEGYINDHACSLNLSKETIQQVFEMEYREAFESRTFLNPLTGAFEEW